MVWCSGWRPFFFFQAEDGIRDLTVTGVQTCALPILALNNRRGPLRDARVRGAINHAVNRSEILATVYGGRGVLAHGAIPPGLAGSDTTRRGDGDDPAAARPVRAEAGDLGGIDEPVGRPW